MKTDLEVGQTIPTGSMVLLTSGSYSDFCITGLFRADADIVIPGKPHHWKAHAEMVDTAALSLLLSELDYVEVWVE